tara:strand:+ start:349 stop:624 length:276 start_codon:yes stop_codon:yes gene_type:complete
MTRDEISRMAIQAGLGARVATDKISINNFKELEAFATIVEAYAQSKEREACAEVCKKHADVYTNLEQNPTTQSAWAACIDIRDAIRARWEA